MDKRDVTWYVDMFDRVKVVCDRNITIINGIPAYDDSYTDFKARLVVIKDLMEPLSIEDNGLADAKDLAWKNLALSLKGIMAGVRSYAKKTNNPVLLAQAKYTKSAFTKDRGTEAITLANQLLDLAQAHITALANHNVTPAKMTTANGYLTELTTYNPLPTTQRSSDKASRGILVKHVKENNTLLKTEMDELMRTLEEEQPAFYAEYFAARRIQKTGIRHEKPEDEITDPETLDAPATEPKDASAPDTNPDAEGKQDTNGGTKPDESPGGEEGQELG